MEQERNAKPLAGSSPDQTENKNAVSDFLVVDLESFVEAEDRNDIGSSDAVHNIREVTQALFQNEGRESDEAGSDDDDEDEDSGTNHFNMVKTGTQLQRSERSGGSHSSLPDTFQTGRLLFYERFKAYQDYILGDCKPSEVKTFTADYLKKVVQSSGWGALWSTDLFDVLVEVHDADFSDLKACVKLVLPLKCEARGCEINEETMTALLEATQHKVPLMELQVVYDESGDYDQTALGLEHLRFFYKHVWRVWDEEDGDDDYDYFVRCVEPRLRLHYDILEERVPAGLVSEYKMLLENCEQCFQEFSVLRRSLGNDSDSELDNVSMVEGQKLDDQLETFKRKLNIIENPLLRYVLGYKGNARHQFIQSRGQRESGIKVAHVVTASCTTNQLHSLLNDRLLSHFSSEETEIQFHSDPVSAVDSCHQGDMVFVLPGVYIVARCIFLPDSITIEGFGLPDEVVIEKKYSGDSFIESTAADVQISNIKFIENEAIEGILCVRKGCLTMENCVLQCETAGVVVQTSAQLTMKMCDLYGSKGAGIEISRSSVCTLVGNGIHHCKDGILIKDLADEANAIPSITMENNVIHNNEGYGVILVKPSHSQDRNITLDQRIYKDEAIQDGAGHPVGAPSQTTSHSDVPPKLTENSHHTESARKWHTSCSVTLQDLISHQVFVSIQGNQFRRNGIGDFGTFLY
ncbi:SHC SH2 domain-binding protein 1 [Dunckerocampus dactyliophorus]|uniref:SHC SH2 domain-binding protein 1 n=1 Tax=Dunckerocampus dactyliophorus TaxID=161453 RepID=UPI002405D7A3|nr:SHC SH2 domain-binding protein 1 [Dunckerocampus dactyliophorus]